MTLSRRDLLRLGLMAPVPMVLLACGGDDPEPAVPSANNGEPATTATTAPANAAVAPTVTSGTVSGATSLLTPTPACGDDDDPTPAQTEGPYFTPNSPLRVSLVEAGMQGMKLTLEGAVLTRSCRAIPNALVDFWQCDNAGVYDNSGFRLRGHQMTDANGRYKLETIVPGLYTGRTRHIHVKVQAPNRPVLTSQLYFPNEAANQRDGIYSADLLLEDYRDVAGGKAGVFTFVLDIA